MKITVDRFFGKWKAQCQAVPYKRTFLGFFDTKEEAQKAYKEAVDNIPDEL